MTNKLILTTPNDLEVVITRVFNAPRRLVFDCYTKPELVRQWLIGPANWVFVVCDIDLRVGGAYRYVWRAPDGSEMGMGGIYREIQGPERLVDVQLFDEDWTGGETLNTLILTEHNGKTTATHRVKYASLAARDGALRTGMVDGMSAGFDRLDLYLQMLV